ncbi:MAG: hypothetical protein AAFP19_14425 [Bacteroidota bacterium]
MNRFQELDNKSIKYGPLRSKSLSTSHRRPYAKQKNAKVLQGIWNGAKVLKDIASMDGDVTWAFEKMMGRYHPSEQGNARPYSSKGTYQKMTFEVINKYENLIGDEVSLKLLVEFQYNGYAVADVFVKAIEPNKAFGYDLHVEGKIVPQRNAYADHLSKKYAKVNLELAYNYKRPMMSNHVHNIVLELYGNGTVDQFFIEKSSARKIYEFTLLNRPDRKAVSA